MGSSSGEDFSQWDVERPSAHEEKIFVSVRIRPLNEKERTRNDIAEWECINNTTIISKNNLHERSLYPAAYTFGKKMFSSTYPAIVVILWVYTLFCCCCLHGHLKIRHRVYPV